MLGWERAHFDLQSLIKRAVLCIQSHRPAVERTSTGSFFFFPLVVKFVKANSILFGKLLKDGAESVNFRVFV